VLIKAARADLSQEAAIRCIRKPTSGSAASIRISSQLYANSLPQSRQITHVLFPQGELEKACGWRRIVIGKDTRR
jgi:hypothetical protein